MPLILHLGDVTTEVPADLVDGDLVLDRAAVLAATGWEVEDHDECARLDGGRVVEQVARDPQLLDRPPDR